MIYARQSTAIIVTVGPVLDADGVAVTGGVVADFKIAKNGGAPAALNGSATATHRHTGFYSLSLTASDVANVGTVEITIDDTVNACPMKEVQVVEEAVYDALFAASAPGYGTAQTGDAYAIVNSGTHGNAALKTLIDTLDNLVDTEIAGIITTLGTPAGASISADLVVIDNFVDDLETRLTATRAGYLDLLPDINAGFADVYTFTDTLNSDWADGGRLDLLVDAILADTDSLDTTKITTARAAVLTDWIDGGRLDLILDARASQSSVDTIDDLLDTEVAAITSSLTTLSTDVGAVPTNAELTTALAASWTTALAEPAARTDGSPGSPSQYLHELLASQQEKSISGTTMLWKKLNGSTTLATMTLDSSSAPTSVTRAS